MEEKLTVKTFVNTDQENWRHLKVGGTQGAGPSLFIDVGVVVLLLLLLRLPSGCWVDQESAVAAVVVVGLVAAVAVAVVALSLSFSQKMFLYRNVSFRVCVVLFYRNVSRCPC